MSRPPERDPSAPLASPAAYAEVAEERETVMSLFGASTRAGAWTPAELVRAIAGFGNVKLDFCRADLPAGVTEVETWAVFGNVEIFVPRGLEVELSGVALLGNIEHRSSKGVKAKRLVRDWLRRSDKSPPRDVPAEDPPQDPEAVLVIRSTALLGNVIVRVV